VLSFKPTAVVIGRASFRGDLIVAQIPSRLYLVDVRVELQATEAYGDAIATRGVA